MYLACALSSQLNAMKCSGISEGIHRMCYDSIPITYRAPALIPQNYTFDFDSQSLYVSSTKPAF